MKKFLFILCFTFLSTLTYSQPGRQNYIDKIFFLNTEVGWVSGESGIYKTTDGGSQWNIENYEVNNFNYIMFIDDSIGYMSSSKFLKTTDKGNTWEIISEDGIAQFYFLDELLGYAINYYGNPMEGKKFIKTTDGGVTWDSLFKLGYYTEGMWINDKNTFTFYGGESWDNYFGFLSTTTNGGADWIIHSYKGMVYNITFLDSNIGFGFKRGYEDKEKGGLLYTSDGGNSWNLDSIINNCMPIFFTDSLNGYGVDGIEIPFSLWKTTNSGKSWFSLRGKTPPVQGKYYFVNNNYGYHIAKNGMFHRTTDGGYTWILVGSIPNVTSQEETNIPLQFSLQHNYPNPFNPSTKIKYTLPKQGLVTIKVYDVLGKEVELLVNEEKPSGEYQVEFDGSSLTSGIYFYQIQAGEFLDTKKMVLMK